MSKIRVRSYLDGNAPQFNAAEKNGIIPFFKAMFEQESYGNVTPIGFQLDLVNNQIIFEFDSDPGYSAGNLIQIIGSGLRSFTEDYFRVVSTDGLRLFIKYDFNILDQIPTDFDVSKIIIRHAPMDWEVLYSTDTQFSFRSKSDRSSKQVITAKRPQKESYDTSTYIYTTMAHVSKGVNTETGEIIEDWFQKRINEIPDNTESPYQIRVASNYRNNTAVLALNNTTTKYAWHLVGDDRFFYLILSDSHNEGNNNFDYINFNRNPGNADTRRSVYMFGDPDKIIDDAPEDPTGFIFNCQYYNTTSFYTYINTNSVGERTILSDYPGMINTPSNRTHQDCSCFFLRDYTNLPGDTTITQLHTMSFCGSSISSPFSYPGPFSHGVYFFPIYISVMYHNTRYNTFDENTGAYLRAKLPWAVHPFQSLRNLTTSWVDLDHSIIKASGKDILSFVTYAGTNTLYRAVHFELD